MLDEFRRIQTLCDFIYLIPLPLGISAYAKSGNVDVAGYHVRSIAGGMLFGDQWVFFAFVINWTAGPPPILRPSTGSSPPSAIRCHS